MLKINDVDILEYSDYRTPAFEECASSIYLEMLVCTNNTPEMDWRPTLCIHILA